MKKIKLLLSGGGVLYPVHIGAILRLAELGYCFEKVIGVSGGAIVAAALASGYKPNNELVEFAKKIAFSKNSSTQISKISLFRKMGLIDGVKLDQALNKYYAKSFRDVKLPIVLMAVDLNRGCLEAFDSIKNESMSLAMAVRASMAIPGIFTPVKIAEVQYIDGSELGSELINEVTDQTDVLELKVRSGPMPEMRVSTWADYAYATSYLRIKNNNQSNLNYNHKVIYLDSKYNSLYLNMSDKDIMDMILEGYSCINNSSLLL